MFREEKVYIVDIKESCLKLENADSKVVALIFIKDNKLIIRTEGFVDYSSIKAPSINIL